MRNETRKRMTPQRLRQIIKEELSDAMGVPAAAGPPRKEDAALKLFSVKLAEAIEVAREAGAGRGVAANSWRYAVAILQQARVDINNLVGGSGSRDI